MTYHDAQGREIEDSEWDKMREDAEHEDEARQEQVRLDTEACAACRDGLPHGPEHIPDDHSFPDSEEAYQEHLHGAEKPESILVTNLTERGWSFAETGGGCTAYTKPTNDPSANGKPEGWYWLMTDAMDPVAPTRGNQMVTVGLYDSDGMIVVDLTVSIKLILYGDLVFEDSYA